MTIQLKNKALTVSLSTFGGALTSIKDTEGIEYLWQGDPEYWSGQAPVLFPICGSLRGDKTIYDSGEVGCMPRHGLVRKSEFEMEQMTDNSITFLIKPNEDMLANYPYRFELRITYTLFEKTIRTAYEITNSELEKVMPFFIGGHPGFNCPLLKDEQYEDYFLEFEKEETCSIPKSYPETGLLDVNDRSPFFKHQQILNLDYDLFSHDAITLDNICSRSVTLKSRKSGSGLRLDFPDFNNLILWSTVNRGPFIALEPWSGLSTSLEEGDKFIEKPQVTLIAPGQTSKYCFDITIL